MTRATPPRVFLCNARIQTIVDDERRSRAVLVSVLVSFVIVRLGSGSVAGVHLSTGRTLATVHERGFTGLESVFVTRSGAQPCADNRHRRPRCHGGRGHHPPHVPRRRHRPGKGRGPARHPRLSCPSDNEMRVIRVATPQISPPSVSVRDCQNRWRCSGFGHRRTVADVLPRPGGLEGHRSPKCPAAVGCSRLSSGICGECARKLSMKGTFSLVKGLPLMVCKSIAKASKVRILHLPPRAQRAPDQRKRRSRALSCGPAVIGSKRLSTAVCEKYVRKLRPRPTPRRTRALRLGPSSFRPGTSAAGWTRWSRTRQPSSSHRPAP